jgi:hypothetical protein
MRIALVLAVFAVSAPAIAEESAHTAKPPRTALICKKFSQRTSGLTRICYYDCGGSEGAVTTKTYEPCPRWMPRWRLNRTGQFGPSGVSR